ncbi:MAG: acyl-CoA thioesterase [Spirochaetia bacterium]|nr:acyl-CoA thioesterase [Spirochaetia bacterium]
MATIKFEIPVYTFDIDFNGHVSNIVYIQWMEIGRLKLLEAVGLPISKIVEDGFGPLLVETSISYKKPLFLSNVATIELWLSEIGKASAWIEFQILNEKGELAAMASQRGLFINYKSGKPHRITSEDRARFELYLIDNSLNV